MKYPIITSSPLRALFLGACLLAPRAVQSETVFLDDILALAPGINWADATRRLQDQMNFHRSLELDPIFNELIDDDFYLEYLSGINLDDTFLQCMRDLNTFYNENPGIVEAEEKAMSEPTITIDVENFEATMEYPEEVRQIARQQCADVGGHFETTGDILCTMLGAKEEVTISGLFACAPNTASCTPPGRSIMFEMTILVSNAQGMDCDLKDSSAALDSAGGKIAPSSFAFAGLLVAATSFVQV